MATGKMFECEVRADFMKDGKIETRWKVDRVEFIADGKEIRCLHCHGPVKIHRQQKPLEMGGVPDHVEHLPSPNSDKCQGSHYFKPSRDKHEMSATPII